MFSKVYSSATFGIDAVLVELETHYEKQLPSIIIVGLPDNAVRESKERVRCIKGKSRRQQIIIITDVWYL